MECDCEQWKNGITQIDGFIDFASMHGMEYKGAGFKFCPWCGKKLEWPANMEPVIDIYPR